MPHLTHPRTVPIALIFALLVALFSFNFGHATEIPSRTQTLDLPICSYISSHVATPGIPDQHYWGDLIEMNYRLTGNTMGTTMLMAFELAETGAPLGVAPISIPAIGDNLQGYGAFDSRGGSDMSKRSYEMMFVHYQSGSLEASCRSNAHYVTLDSRDALSAAHETERTKTTSLPVCSSLDAFASTIDSPQAQPWGSLIELNYTARQSTSYSALVAFEIDRSGIRPNSKIIALPSIHDESTGYGALDTRTPTNQSVRNYEMMFVHYNEGEDTPSCRSNSHHVRLIP